MHLKMLDYTVIPFLFRNYSSNFYDPCITTACKICFFYEPAWNVDSNPNQVKYYDQ